MRSHWNSPAVLVYSRILSTVLMVVVATILARELGPEGRGVTASLFALQALIPGLLSLGLPLAIRRRVRDGNVNADVGGAVVVALASVPLVLGVAFAATGFFAGFLNSNEQVLVFVLFSLIPLSTLNRVLEQVLIGREQYRRQALATLSQSVGMLGALVVASLVSPITLSVAFLVQLCGLVVFWVTTWLLAAVVPHLGIRRELYREGLTYAPRDIVHSVRERIDQFIALPLIGASGAGLYSVAVMVGTLPTVVAHAVGVSAFSAAQSSADSEKPQVMANFVRASFALTLGASVVIAGVTPWLLPLVFGEEFRGSVIPTFVFLSLYSLGLAIRLVATGVLNTSRRGVEISLAEASGFSVGLVLALMMGPALGPLGLALSWSIDQVLTAVLLLWRTEVRWRLLRTPLPRSVWHRIVRGSEKSDPPPLTD